MSEDTKFQSRDKWHEYGTTPYKFPEMWTSGECGDFYDAEYVKDWFKRCITDMPKYPKFTDDVDNIIEYAFDVDTWQEKWFSQFETSQRDDDV